MKMYQISGFIFYICFIFLRSFLHMFLSKNILTKGLLFWPPNYYLCLLKFQFFKLYIHKNFKF